MLNKCWTEIDLEQMKLNLDLYRKAMPCDAEIMAVVKADAYGHGDGVVSAFLQGEGITNFAVSNIDEALHVRRAGVSGRILILGYTPPDRAEELEEFNITQALLSEEYAEALAASGHRIRCQFALDTGMRRIGLNADDIDACERVIRRFAPMLEGLFTHLCVADTPSEKAFTQEQIAKFEAVCDRVADLKLPCCHAMNSAGGLWHRSRYHALARLGIILYGLKPDSSNILPEGIRPALTWKTVVSMVKTVHPGDTVGYGRAYHVTRDMQIATLPTGYADGYSRQLSDRGWVLINGKRAAIVGRVCMDQMMVDVSGIEGVKMGTEVILLGTSGEETLTADGMAALIGTIGYEVICGISKRVDRVYKGL